MLKSVTWLDALAKTNELRDIDYCLLVDSNSELSLNNYCFSRSILNRICKIWKTNAIKPTSWCALEHVRLIYIHFVLHKLLIDCMYIHWIASKHFQTISSQFVPSCHKAIVSVGLFYRSIITWSAWSYILS